MKKSNSEYQEKFQNVCYQDKLLWRYPYQSKDSQIKPSTYLLRKEFDHNNNFPSIREKFCNSTKHLLGNYTFN